MRSPRKMQRRRSNRNFPPTEAVSPGKSPLFARFTVHKITQFPFCSKIHRNFLPKREIPPRSVLSDFTKRVQTDKMKSEFSGNSVSFFTEVL